ncbi:MAG: alpha/beta hydrolase [Wenzhouxiangella sp.]|nr:alpha/beta hydrolase [Wenzhouxiangella sp.]
MASCIRRSFVRVGDGLIHFRHAGSGPALVMLHQSPQNSRMWLEQIERLAERYLVIAPDLPGFGWSDPLAVEQPTIEDLAAALNGWLDALGIDQCAVFGMHTGAIVAIHMGLARPDRIARVLVDGYAIFNDQERALLGKRYLPPFEPDWSGQHLRWLWARMREQNYFFPWYEQTAACALRLPAPDLEKTEAAVRDILEVGDQYRLGYRAALNCSDRSQVAALSMPACLYYREDDVLLEHRQRLPALPDNIRAPALADRTALWTDIERELARWNGPVQSIKTSATAPGWQRLVLATETGDLACWVHQPARTPAHCRLVVHGLGQAPLQPVTAGENTLILQPDLPGHGASSEWSAQALSQQHLLAALARLVDQLAAGLPLVIESHAASSSLAGALTRQLASQVSKLILIEPWLIDGQQRDWLLAHLPDMTPRPAGGHLLEAWQWERERHLYPPWQAACSDSRLPGDAPVVDRVHANTVTLIGLGRALKPLLADCLAPDTQQRIQSLAVPVEIIKHSPN